MEHRNDLKTEYSADYTILPSMCDSSARLGISHALDLFMDMGTLHSRVLGVGPADLFPKGLFWLTVRTKARFFRRPALLEDVTVHTWPIRSEGMRCLREYEIDHNGETLVSARTEWALLDTATGSLKPVDDIFPADLACPEKPVFDDPFARVDPDFSGAEALGIYRVRSTDIDLGRHMNNVAYARALLGLFSSERLRDMRVSGIELNFRSPCREGDELHFYIRSAEDSAEVGAFLPDGKNVLLAKLAGKRA